MTPGGLVLVTLVAAVTVVSVGTGLAPEPWLWHGICLDIGLFVGLVWKRSSATEDGNG